VFAGGVAVWSLARRVPLVETRRFLTAPVQVGDAPRPAPAAPAAPTDVAGRWAAAEEAFHAGRWADAATHFAWVVTHDPQGPQAGPAQWNLVRSRLRSGEGTGALAALDDLLRHHGAYLGAESPALREGLDLLARNDLSAALAAFRRAVREQPEGEFAPLAHAMMARVHWAHGEPMEAVRAFARLFASVKDAVPAYGQLARQLERYAAGDASVTEEFGRLAHEGQEGFRDIYQYLEARSLLEQNRFTAARDALEELRRRHPGGDFSQIVDLEHAWNLLRNGRPAEALPIFQRLEAAPPLPEMQGMDRFFDLRAELPLGIARAHLALGRHAEAAAAFERALAERPDGIYAVEDRVGLAMAYEGQGQLERAAAVLHEVIDRHPDEPKLWALRQQLSRIEDRIASR
jgi:outer membrane protein assembly factor BamD (BamD/ComL family)